MRHASGTLALAMLHVVLRSMWWTNCVPFHSIPWAYTHIVQQDAAACAAPKPRPRCKYVIQTGVLCLWSNSQQQVDFCVDMEGFLYQQLFFDICRGEQTPLAYSCWHGTLACMCCCAGPTTAGYAVGLTLSQHAGTVHESLDYSPWCTHAVCVCFWVLLPSLGPASSQELCPMWCHGCL